MDQAAPDQRKAPVNPGNRDTGKAGENLVQEERQPRACEFLDTKSRSALSGNETNFSPVGVCPTNSLSP